MYSKTNYRIPWFPGLVLGILAFGATFLLVKEFVSYGYEWTTIADLDSWQIDLWYTFSAHHVPLTQTASSGAETVPIGGGVNLIGESSTRFQFLYLIPPLPLFVTGLLLADRVGGRYKASYSFLNGAFVAIGYCLSAVGLAWFSAESATGFGFSARLGPSLGETFFIAGLVYPIVFGGLGGLAHYVTQQL